MRRITKAIVHYSASKDVPASTIRRWHLNRGFKDCGYHKVIRRDGTVELGRPESEIGAHTKGFNKESLGVVLTGSNDEPWYATDAQYRSLNRVLEDWIAKYGIMTTQIFFHKELNATSCPGRLDKKRILAALEREPMYQRGRSIRWPNVPSGDKIVVGNPHPSKRIKVKIRNGGVTDTQYLRPETSTTITAKGGYLKCRSLAVMDSVYS